MRLDTDLIKLNFNLIICTSITAATSAVLAEILATYDNHVNTTGVSIASFVTYTVLFGLIFWRDARKRYPHMSHRRIISELGNVIKSMSTGIIITVPQMWFLNYVFLELGVPPYMTAIIAKMLADATFMGIVSVFLRKTHTF